VCLARYKRVFTEYSPREMLKRCPDILAGVYLGTYLSRRLRILRRIWNFGSRIERINDSIRRSSHLALISLKRLTGFDEE